MSSRREIILERIRSVLCLVLGEERIWLSCPMTSAPRPQTTGVAIDVPSKDAYLSTGTVEIIATPGAHTSTCEPLQVKFSKKDYLFQRVLVTLVQLLDEQFLLGIFLSGPPQLHKRNCLMLQEILLALQNCQATAAHKAPLAVA